MVAAGQLAGDLELLARDSGAADRLTDLDLVVVVHCRVDQPVAHVDRADDGVDAFVAPERIGAEADGRQCRAVGQRAGLGHGPTVPATLRVQTWALRRAGSRTPQRATLVG